MCFRVLHCSCFTRITFTPEHYLKHFLIILFVFLSANLFGQIEILPGTLDYGTTTPETQWVIDVHITNKGPKKDFLLRHTFSHEYEVLFTSKSILPDSSIVMRVKFSPRMKESYREKIELYFASMSEPIILPVNANVDYLNPDDHIPCPNFSRLAADCCKDNFFMVEVVDAATGEPIDRSEVKISERNISRMKLQTMNDGKVSHSIPIGYYGIEATHPDYFSSGLMSYINHRNAYFKIELERKNVELPPMIESTVDTMQVEVVGEIQLMPDEDFRPNNVVYLLDISSSMLQGDKLELMKSSLIQMSKALRKQDKITLISYAADAKIILETTTGDQQAVIRSIVEGMHADGSTSGASGFSKSYEVLKREFLDEGNNQLIVITDGIFQPEDQKRINKLVRKSVKKNFTTSIVGIQCAFFAKSKLTEVSTLGKGSFLLIEQKEDLNVLIEELKRRSAN